MGVNPLPAVAQTLQHFQPAERFSVERFSVEAMMMQKKKVEKAKHIDPIDHIFKASQWYLRGATAVDMTTTVIGMEHAHGVESGWGKCLGAHNTPAVVAWNVGLNLGTEYLSRKIYRKGGKWRYAAVGLNLLKGSDNLMAGFHNASYIAKH